MGIVKSKPSYDPRGNAKIHLLWTKNGGNDKEKLKQDLCIYQNGKDIKQKKLLWVPTDKGKIPIIITKDTNIKELETNVVPVIFSLFDNVRISTKKVSLFRSHKDCVLKTKITQKNFWDEWKNEDILQSEDWKPLYCFSCFGYSL